MTDASHNGAHRDPTAYLSLAEAARHAPGHPSPNCIWRWCRRGVLARGGRRVYLHHLRSGGKMYTTAAWVGAFCRELTEADREYFEAKDAQAATAPPRESRYGPQARRAGSAPESARPGERDQSERELERELEGEGL
ncbi:MAG: hypothetical protein IT431_06030 [Phycisphaerales bacterium]|nr:hypothetical protein [Phycisphaerales bacterium]